MSHLIDKDAAIAEIEGYKNSFCDRNGYLEDNERNGLTYDTLCELENSIDDIEVKEVDLKKEYLEEIYSHLDSIKDTADRMTSGNFMHNRAAIKFSANTIAKVLELMGLKIKKEE